MVERLKKFFLKEKMLEMRNSKSFQVEEIDSLARSYKQFEGTALTPLSQSFAKHRLSNALSFAATNFWKR